MKQPLVSVIMPCYNADKFILEAINSILNQTFSDFEFIIIDDGSTDNTVDIIKSCNDTRVITILHPRNKGNYACRNEGCKLANGKYISVMDADDIAIDTRLERQFSLLEKNPSIQAVGTFFRSICGEIHVKPTGYEFIKMSLLLNNQFLHPSLMIRKDVLKVVGYYDEKYYYSSDYDLVCKIVLQGKIINLPKVLMKYRWHDKQISSTQSQQQTEYANQIRIQYLRNLGFRLSVDEERIFTLMMTNSILSLADIHPIKLVSDEMKKQNTKLDIFDNEQFARFMILTLSKCYLRVDTASI